MAKRLNLREFQRDLAVRLGSAQRGESPRALLGIESGRGADALWLLDLTDAGEIAPLAGITPVALTKPWFAGVTNIRGALFSVVDFSAFRGGPQTPQNADSRLLLIGAKAGGNSALLIDRALGLRSPDELAGEAQPAPAGAPAWHAGFLLDARGERWGRLNIPALLADPEFMDIVL